MNKQVLGMMLVLPVAIGGALASRYFCKGLEGESLRVVAHVIGCTTGFITLGVLNICNRGL